MIFLVTIILILNGIGSFWIALRSGDPSVLWALLAVNYIFFLGVSQTGIIFSSIMRITKSGWGRTFSRLGEALTLSFAPFAFIMFIVLYAGGAEHIFYWYDPEKFLSMHGGHGPARISPWVGKKLVFCRILISMAFFYVMSIVYYMTARLEDKGVASSYDRPKRLNIIAGFVMFAYVVENTFLAWDFGMMIIPHWESSIFPPYFWGGNLLSGSAFLFLMSRFFAPDAWRGEGHGGSVEKRLDGLGKVMLGFVLLWVYLFWSQHIVLWFSNLSNLADPVFKRMQGDFALPFWFMIFTLFILPFLGLLFRFIKHCGKAMAVVAFLILIGVWTNRYLMIIPEFADGSRRVALTWTGISLILAGLSAVLLSFAVLKKKSQQLPLS
jgi:hypothetical protein